MNNFIGIGRLTKDIELRYTDNQLAVAKFSIAIDRGKDKNGESRGADFPNVIAFGRTAENLSKFSGKGLRVCVHGHIQTGKYDDKSGKTVYTTDVIADRVEFIDWKEKNAHSEDYGFSGYEGFNQVSDDDLPF